MQRITQDGVKWRTKLMTYDMAARFANCIGANRRFAGVNVLESGQAKHPERRYFVEYLPASTARREELWHGQQFSRLDRAVEQLGDYQFVQDGEHGVWVFNPDGDVYAVNAWSCTCGDWQWRCQQSGMQCKHQLMLPLAFQQGLVGGA